MILNINNIMKGENYEVAILMEDTSKSGKSIDFQDPENRRFSRKP